MRLSRGICSCAALMLLAACATVSEDTRNRADANRQLADMKLQKGEVELAIGKYRASLDLYEKDAETHFGLAQAYRIKGEYVLAERHVRRAISLEPKHHEARLELGAIHLFQERWAEAIAENQRLIEDPSFLRPSRALVNRGWAHYMSGDLDQAQRDFSEALRGDGANYHAHLNLGIVLYDRGDVVEAIQHFGQVLEILDRRPSQRAGYTEAEARFRMAQAHVKLGHHSKAVEQLRIAAEQGGQGKWGLKSKEYLAVLE